MTEQEWLARADPKRMLAFRQGRALSRKRLLYGCACCRLIWPLLPGSSRQAVAVCEGRADGRCGADEMEASRHSAQGARVQASENRSAVGRGVAGAEEAVQRLRLALVAEYAAGAAESLAGNEVERAVASSSHAWRIMAWQSPAARQAATWWMRSTRAELLRCVFGNPYRPITLDRSSLTADVVALAQAAYDERIMPSGQLDVVRLAVLADALEEQGGARELVDHLRSPGPHVKGCFVLDRILGKA